MKVSVITVCYNAENLIAQTMQSVLNQNYTNIEYIVIDGASSDGTMEIIKHYAAIDSRVRYISERDRGVYDAMNKGIELATGDYLEFLNAGDLLVDSEVIGNVVKKIIQTDADVVYGNIIYEFPDGTSKVRIYGALCSSLFYYLLGDCINHQAVFAKKECFEHHKFNMKYQICADREWMMQIKKEGKKFKPINRVICRYPLNEDSVSIRNKELYNWEAVQCIKEYFKVGYLVFWLLNKIRSGKMSAKILHFGYSLIFLKKTEKDEE